jgi:autotransporter-associated beta strand protein
VAYWWGGINSSWAAQNSGTAQTNPFYANFTSDPAGTSNTLTLPSSTTNVFFTTSNAMNQNATTLDQAFTINSLNFTSGNTGSTISAGSETNAQTYNTLTINAAAINGNAGNNGITVNTGSGPNTINANVILGASQTWTNASSNVLTVAGSVTNNGNTLSTAGAGPIAISGNIGGNGGFTAGGSGTVTLSGTNGYTGVTTAAGGTLQFTSEASLYNDATAASWSASNIIVQSGATLALSVGGTGQFSTTDVATLLANLDGTVASDGLMGGSAIGFDTTSAAGGNFTISGNITDTTGTGGGSVGVTKLGTNTLTLQGTNTYTGVLTLDGGILNAATSNIDGTSTTNGIVFNGGTLQAASGGITTAKAVTLNAGGGTFDTGAAATSTLSGAIGGAGGLTVIGSGLLTLQGANNYTGVLTLNGGVLNAATTNINGSSTTNGIVFNGGTLQAASGGITTGKAVTLNAGGGTFDTGTAATSALSGVIGGAGGLTVVGTGTVTLGNASSSYSGGTSISSGTVIVSASQASGTSNGPVGYGTGAITLAGGRLSSNASGETLYNPINVTGTTGQLTTGGTSNNPYGNLLLYGAVTGNGEFTVGNSFVNTYAASVELFDSLSGFTGTVNYIGNATDNLIFSNAVNTTANFTLSGSTSSQYLQFPNATNTIGALSGTGGLIKGPGTLQINQSASTAFAGILGGSTALNVTKAGSGMLSLTNANTYTGVTTITGGILSTGSTGILANGGTASYIGQSTNAAANLVLNGGTLQYANTTNTAESTDRLLTLLGNGSLDASGSSTITFAGNGTGAANAISVTASSSPTLTFTGTNTGANTFKPIIGNKNGTIITSVAKTGAGAWVLSGTNTYTGGTSINNGTLAVSNASALGTTGNLSFGGGTLQYIGINTDFSSRFSTAASQAYSVDTNGQAVAFETPLTSSGGSLAVSDTAGTGNLTLTGASTYNGATTINAGATLYLGNGTTDGSIASTSGVNLSGTLVYNLASSPRTVAYSIGGTGTGGNVTLNGPQALTLTAANTYSGTTSVAGGTLYVSNTSGSGTGTSAVNVTGGTLSGTGSIAGNIALSSASTTGTLEPGTQSAATGKLTASAGSVGGTGNYVADIAFGTAAGNGSPPDTASELMATGGAVDVSHMNFSVNLLGAAAGTTGAITPNETFVIVDSTTPITVNGSTVFGSLASPQGGLTYTVAYNATGGFPGAVNDSGTSDAEIAVTIDSVPEPTSLGFIGLAGVGLMRRRRRRTIA